MFKRIVSSLIIFSLLASDLTGWGNKPVSAMMDPDEGERRQLIPVSKDFEETLQDDFLEDLNGPQPLIHSTQELPQTMGEKKPEEEHQKKDCIIPDLGQGIVPSPMEGEGLSLSLPKLTNLSLPQKEGEKDQAKDHTSHITSSEKSDKNEPLPESPVDKGQEFLNNLLPSDHRDHLPLVETPEKEGSLNTSLRDEKNQNENRQSETGDEKTLPCLVENSDHRAQEEEIAVEQPPLEKFVVKIQLSPKEQPREEQIPIVLEQPTSSQENKLEGDHKDIPNPLEILLNVKLEDFTEEQVAPQNGTGETKLQNTSSLCTVPEETKPEEIKIEEELGEKDRVASLQEETVIIALNSVQEGAQENKELRNTPPSIRVPDEKTPLLPKKRHILFDEKPQEKNDNLNKGWELTGEGSDEEMPFKQKKDGFHTDGSEEPSFDGDIRITKSGTSEDLEKNPRKPLSKTDASLRALLSDSDGLEDGSDGEQRSYYDLNNNSLPEHQRSGEELAYLQRRLLTGKESTGKGSTGRESAGKESIGSELNSPFDIFTNPWNPSGNKRGSFPSQEKRISLSLQGKRDSLSSQEKRVSFPFQGLLINEDGGGRELEEVAEFDGFIVVPLNQTLNLSPETEDFLRHVKVRIIDGKLNGKQILGIFGGVVVGAGVAWPWMVIMFDSLLDIYNFNVDAYYFNNAKTIAVDPNVLDKKFRDFNHYLNLKTMMILVGIPVGVSVASRTVFLLVDLAKDSIHTFSSQKSIKYSWALFAAKGSAYFGAFFVGLLPVYYLYHSLLGCDLYDYFEISNDTNREEYLYYVSMNIHLNISNNVMASTDFPPCRFEKIPLENFLLFRLGAPFLFLSTFLHYGHQVSKSLTHWVNNYFSGEGEELSLTSLKTIRQEHITQFKHLKPIIASMDRAELNTLYDSVFKQNIKLPDPPFEISDEDGNIKDTLRVLKLLDDFYHHHKSHLEELQSEEWKKRWASRIGWAFSLTATFGRMLIYQYVIVELLGSFWGAPGADLWSTDYINPSLGATILSCLLGYSVAHLAQGWGEKKAVEECIYELLGGKKFSHGHSHPPLRVGLKIWDYLYGTFLTLPYLVIGFATTQPNWTNLYLLQYPTIYAGQILSLFSFGIADVFNNAVAYHRSNTILLDTCDRLFSHYYAFEGYKQDKLMRMVGQLQKLFKEMDPSVLKKIHQILGENHKNLKKESLENAEGSEPLLRNQSLLKEPLVYEENRGLNHGLSLETQEFLQYVMAKVVKGTLNWKQKVGIGGGILTGFAISWPLMAIIFDSLLTPLFQSFHPSQYYVVPEYIDPAAIKGNLTKFNEVINFYTLTAFVGIPMGIDAASRNATILGDLTAENTSSFSIQKTRAHWWSLLCAKGGIYFATIFASFLPVYYLYDSLFGYYPDPCDTKSNNTCSKQEGWFYCYQAPNGSFYCPSGTPSCFTPPYDIYTYTISPDIFFNINTTVNSPDFCKFSPELADKILFWTGAPFLFFDTILFYGHQLSSTTEKWVNDSFFAKMRASPDLSPFEALRPKYLTQFKGLKRVIYKLDDDGLDNLYAAIFTREGRNLDQKAELNPEELTINEALRILKAFQALHHQHKNDVEDEKPEEWKKIWASRIGSAVSLIATFGRLVIFQVVLANMLGHFWLNEDGGPNLGVDLISCILAGIFANLSQGWIEKEAVEKGVYDLLGGEKVPEGSSHSHIRRGIKAWDYLYGIFHTLPYLAVGAEAAGYTIGGNLFIIQPWQILLLLSFGIADAFNNAVAFHDSNLNVVNAYDRLVTSYGTPSTEQKKDRLIHIVRKLRKLFKDLRPDVLEEVDRALQHGRKNFEQTDPEDGNEREKRRYSNQEEYESI